MGYEPTGKPPGRPPKPKPAEPSVINDQVRQVAGQHRPFELAPCCAACHPDGWPDGWSGYGCEHGIWARRI